jgi:hypothetical protein
MTQDERWNLRYQEVMDFIETNHRNPSKHRIEEHDMLNWLKQQRPAMGTGTWQPLALGCCCQVPVPMADVPMADFFA